MRKTALAGGLRHTPGVGETMDKTYLLQAAAMVASVSVGCANSFDPILIRISNSDVKTKFKNQG